MKTIRLGRGGNRKGAGRPSTGTKVFPRCVTIDPRAKRTLTELGAGNLSLGVRRAAQIIAAGNWELDGDLL